MADSKCCPDWNINLDYEGVACRCCGATLTTEHQSSDALASHLNRPISFRGVAGTTASQPA